jgi:putative heme transporter
VKRLVVVLVVAFVAIHFGLPRVAGLGRALHLLAHVKFRWMFLAVGLEIGSILAYTQLTKAVLPRGEAPRLFTLLRVQLSTLAVSRLVPGGTAAGGALGYRLLTRAGVPGTDAAFALATQGIGSAVVLNVLLLAGLVVSIPIRGVQPLYGTAAVLGVLLVGGFSVLVVLLVRGEERAGRIMRAVARKIPLLDEKRVHEVTDRLARRLQVLAGDRELVRRAVFWATANWLLDAASLWVFVGAFGKWVPIDGLLISFGLANVLAAIPVTPSGLVVVDVVLVSTLTGFGTPHDIAIVGVLVYRLVSFWLPIPLGGLAYLSLQAEPGGGGRRAGELRRAAERAVAEAEPRGRWAERHGLRVEREAGGPTAGDPPGPAPS